MAAIHVSGVRCDPCGAVQRIYNANCAVSHNVNFSPTSSNFIRLIKEIISYAHSTKTPSIGRVVLRRETNMSVRDMKACRWSRCRVPFVLNVSTR